jgi:glycosyltransferase involved in cell wall biosynthesis
MKLFLAPQEFTPDNGVGQVITAQRRYLPEFGIELVDDPTAADLRAAHILSPLVDNDVLHCHGLYWNGDEPGHAAWEAHINKKILETASRALAITVPSEWVGMPFKREMRLSPDIIPHGLNLEDWQPLPVAERKNYLVWNKNRVDTACNPDAAIELAKRGLPVVSTFGDLGTMQVTGPLPHAQMKQILRSAGVYLSTARETFGIGILEALACGVPVLGYAIGGITELVVHKANGYLVEPGDIDGLEAGYKWILEHLAEMQLATAAALMGRDWRTVIGRYAKLYQEVLEEKQRQRKVSIVITCYNYGDYVGKAIESALNQTMPAEVIVIDDASGPETHAVLEGYRLKGEADISYNLANLGVANSRNRGIARATGDYVVCLDADDWLEPGYVETLYQALEADRALGVAYTGLRQHFDSGDSSVGAWPPSFDFEVMARPGVPPPNTIPCAAMFRRRMWERAGGYRQQYAPGEDVEFWLRGLSIGFDAKRITDEPLFNYRAHAGSASKTKQYKDITGDKPWVTDRSLMPAAAPTEKPNLVRSYSDPLVSVIIPVGPGHAKHLNKAIDSLLAQTFKAWEVIVIDDAPEGIEKDVLEPYPFVKLLETHPYYDSNNSFGAGVARNVGIAEAKAPLLFFLDADDWLAPNALEELVRTYTKEKPTFVYSDWFVVKADGSLEEMNTSDYNQEAVKDKIQHAVSVLVEAEAVREVGGFDESLPTYEDWDFFLRLAARGFCGTRLAQPLLYYRIETGTRRLKAQEPGSNVYQQIVEKWKEVKFMACGACGGSPTIQRQAYDALAYPPSEDAENDGKVKMRFVGLAKGTATYLGKYEAADDDFHRIIRAVPQDVGPLLQTGLFVTA